ncbi:ABC transporter ATP-binding protein [Brevibacterium paucivorans]|uniref:ABC transporter ATP-binding protein n=1 Tax=Brevibacterium paucivorans TaxID=170994 RepID=UPI00321ADD9A
MMMRAHISLNEVSKRFGEIAAVDSVSLEVYHGESLVVLGPSGSGKSTLLRLLAGLEDPTEGVVAIDGQDQDGIAPHRRDVAIVFQHFALYPHLTTRKNITMGLRHGLKLPKVEAEQRARDIAKMLGIDVLLDRLPREMSGGQKQRVALARALARRSSVVLLDEPLSGLDAQLHLTLRLEIAKNLREVGATSVMVTHDQADAMATADRIAVMNSGQIEQIGTPDEIYRRPASLFVAGFVGSPPMNLLETFPDDRELTSPVENLQIDNEGGPVTFGVRPEDILPGPGSECEFSGTVMEVEHEGASRILDVSVKGAIVRVRVTADADFDRGSAMQFHCPYSRIAVFDNESGQNLGFMDELSARTKVALR